MKTKIIFISTMATLLGACQPDSKTAANDGANQTDSTLILPEKMNPYTYGIDISSHQGHEVELMDKHADSLTFVICRATDGITFVDSDFKLNWSTIHEKNFIAGAYHFFESDDDPSKQVANYLKAVGEISSTDLPPLVDFEGGGIDNNQSVESVSANLLAVLNELKSQTNRTPILYTDISSGNKYLTNPEFKNFPLWIADYTGNATPILPGVYKGTVWELWQRSDAYENDNVKNDFDIFNGDLSEFLKFVQTH